LPFVVAGVNCLWIKWKRK